MYVLNVKVYQIKKSNNFLQSAGVEAKIFIEQLASVFGEVGRAIGPGYPFQGEQLQDGKRDNGDSL